VEVAARHLGPALGSGGPHTPTQWRQASRSCVWSAAASARADRPAHFVDACASRRGVGPAGACL